MRVLGISPLDKDSTVSVVEDGRILFAAGEERFSRVKQHSGFPHKALSAALEFTGLGPGDFDVVAYPFLDAAGEERLMREAFAAEASYLRESPTPDTRRQIDAARLRIPTRGAPIHGLQTPDQRMTKSGLKQFAYKLLGATPAISKTQALRASKRWMQIAVAEHRKWQTDLEGGLAQAGVTAKLHRSEHHISHAANAYLASGFERALVVTLDGYGSGLAGSIGLGEGGQVKRLHGLRFPHSLGSFYEMVTSSLGYHPDRHAGKIVGLAAYGDTSLLSDILLERFDLENGDLRMHEPLNVFFSRYLSVHFPMVDVAAAWQHVLEVAARKLVKHWIDKTGVDAVVLSGGVAANVKMNQRIHEVDGVNRIFVYPNMGDGGCASGLAMDLSWPGGVGQPFETAYLGPEYTPAQCRGALDEAKLQYTEPANLAAEVAARVHEGQVVARFDGRMEYGPRALGNRSILYHAREAAVNQWLNRRLGRTEFMPFAPVTLWEHREKCYLGLEGAEHAAEFMTVTFDCTDWMKQNCPAAVHIDGTARPQLVKREKNPGYYDILTEYEKLSGNPCLINTSFNMHEEPIVCSPQDAIRAFLLGRVDALVLGPFLVDHPDRAKDTAARPV
jgi:carbamoyltransferase